MKNIIKKSFVCAFAALATLVSQAVSTSYINSSGQPDTADCTEITSSSTTLNTGWYVVNGNVSIGSTVTVNGDVNLILADGAKLTVTGSSGCAGICVVDDGETVNSLTIYCQEGGSGELSATGGSSGAGIGGNDKTGATTLGDCGAVTIYGGVINAIGGSYGAGIGGGDNYGNGGTVAIYGGTVTAKAVSSSTAGIGNGWAGSNRGTLIVGAGRSVMAGESEATAVSLMPDSSGSVTSQLSGQKWFYVGAPSIKQKETELFEGYHSGVAINVALSDTIAGGSGTYTFTEKANLPSWLSISGMSLVGTPPNTGTWTFTLTATDASDSSLTVDAEYTLYVQVTGDVSVTFVGASSAPRTETCTVVEKSMTTLSDTGSSGGWYVVYNDVEFNSTVTVSGNIKLVLMDGKTMAVTATQYKAAVNVSGSGNSLTIYGQSNGTGRLEATAVSIAAGIGGNSSQDGGTVTIYGGTVVATGASGAGIGGGYNAAGGSVAIYGGAVTANGGYAQGGIGGQSDKGQGTLVVGANVVVKAGSSSSPTAVLNSNGETDLTSLLSGQRYFTFETVGPTPLTQTASAFAAYVGQAFEQALSATVSGGTSPYIFEKTSGTLPDGLEFDAGVISGTPTEAASGTVVFTVTDASEPTQSESFTYTITVTQPPKSITYKDGNNTINGLSPTQYTPGTATALAASATKTGYTFVNWYDNDGLAGDPVTEVSASETENKTYWAKWNLVDYTITYHNVTGSLTPATYNIETSTITLPTPEVGEGETFVGWYETSTFTGAAVTQIAQGSTGNMDFYAKITSSSEPEEPEPSGDGFIDDDPEEPAQAWNVVTVECQTAQGVFQRKCKQLSSGYWAELNDSWYYVTGEVTIESVEVVGKASLILVDGATLTVGGEWNPGIQLTQGNTLTIYGQSGGTGALIATGGDGFAGIGGGMMTDYQLCGKLNIYGGNITATGNGYAPGIGSTSMDYDSTSQIYVYGGTVTATAGDYFGGIGGYKWYGQGTLTVGANMTVTAGADVGSAVELTPDANGVVTLSAQKYFHIESTGSVPLAQGRSELAATAGDVIALSSTIVGGKKPYTFTGSVPSGLTLSGGTLTCTTAGEYNFSLTVTDAESAVIQATYALSVDTLEKTITYIDGTDGVTELTGLTPNQYIPGDSTIYLPNASDVTKAGYIFNGWYLTPELTGSAVVAISSSDQGDKTFYAKFTLLTYSISYRDHDNNYYYPGLEPSSYTITNTPVALATPAPRDGFTFDGWCENSDRSDPPIKTLPLNSTGYRTFYAKWTENEPEEPEEPEPGETGDGAVNYIDENGAPQTAYCAMVTADTATLTNGGWYAVNANVARGSIAVEGSAYLVLVDDKTLTVQGAEYYPGIAVTEGNSLTIYGQVGNTGTLNATGGNNGAGIGGGASSAISVDHSAGAITINGGTVIANGGSYSAGIGGGNAGNGGYVTVNGGSVTANSGWVNTPGIGGGYIWSGTDDGTLTVSGNMFVMAGETPFETSEKNPGSATRTITIDKSWGYFSIEKAVAPVGTFSTIYYHDGSSVIDQLEPSQYEEGVGVSLATAVLTKDGYTFGGWYATYACDGDEVTAIPVDATGEQHLWAKWMPNQYTIEYHFGDATLDLAPATYTVGTMVMLPEEVNGYYVRWYDNPQFTGNFILATNGRIGDLTLYASPSSALQYNAKFYDGETLLSTPYTIYFNVESETIILPRTAQKDGHRFIDWYDNVELVGDPVTTIPAGSFENKEFYAKWEETTDPVFTVDAEGTLIHLALNGATEITIPDNVYSIDSHLCSEGDYSAMTSLVIPGTVTNVGYAAFFGCTGLTNLTVGSGVKTIEGSAFFGCTALTCGEAGLYIPDSVIDIGDEAFVDTGLTKASLPGAMYSEDSDVHRGFDLYKGVVYRTSNTVFYIINDLLMGVDPKENADITIPARVNMIGAGAFDQISSVHNVQLHSGITNIAVAAFSGCTGLQSIVIPASVECIGNGSFYGCSGLTNLTIEAGVKLIDSGAFLGCSALTSVVIPGSVERVADMAFWDCVALSSLTIEYGVKAIEEFAFCGCSSLVNVTLPKGLEIERYAFVDCTSLKSVNISGNVVSPKKKLMAAGPRRLLLGAEPAPDPDATSVGDYAFIGCSALESAIIGSKVNEIGGGAFGGCSKLKSITVEEGNTNYTTVDGMLLTFDGTTLVSGAGDDRDVIVPANVISLADGAFAGFNNIESVTLPNTVTTIGEAAFSNCTALATVMIPSSVADIGANAFYETALATVHVSKDGVPAAETLVDGTGFDTNGVNFVEWYWTVTFDANGGTGGTVAYPDRGAAAGAIGKPTKANSKFRGWFADNGSQYIATDPVTADITYIAQWVADEPVAVTSQKEETLVVVPATCYADELVDTTNRETGDMLMAYDTDTGKFYSWEYTVGTGWAPVNVSGGAGDTPGASAYTLNAGHAVWVTRSSEASKAKPINLLKEFNDEPVEVEVKEGWNLIAPTTAEGATVEAVIIGSGATISESDKIVVPTDNAPITYEFVEGKGWGFADAETVEVEVGGQKHKRVRPFHNTEKQTPIPQGTGAWFVSGSDKSINL